MPLVLGPPEHRQQQDRSENAIHNSHDDVMAWATLRIADSLWGKTIHEEEYHLNYLCHLSVGKWQRMKYVFIIPGMITENCHHEYTSFWPCYAPEWENSAMII